MSFNQSLDINNFYTTQELPDIKRELAAAFMRYPQDPMKAIAEIEPRTTHHAALANLQYDAEVNELMRQFRRGDAGVTSLMPSKEEFAAIVYREGMNARHPDTKLDYFKLFAQVMEYTGKKDDGKGATNIAQQNVIVLPAKQDNKDFEGKWIEYGRELTGAK